MGVPAVEADRTRLADHGIWSASVGRHGNEAAQQAGLPVGFSGAGPGKPGRPHRSRAGLSGMLAGQIVVGLLVAVTTGILVLQLRQQALTAAGHEMQSLALTLADQAERAFETVDLVQTTFLEVTRAEGITTPEAFRRRFSGADVNQQLIAHGSALPQLDLMALIDAEGKFVNFNRPLPVLSNSIADRPYFKTLKENPNQTAIVSDPIKSRSSGKWAIVLAHRVSGADGQFLGISFGGVLMGYFESLYQTVSNREDIAVGLFRKDGVLLARYPHVEDSIGKSFGQATVAGRLAASGAESGVAIQTSVFDGDERLIAGHMLAKYPMVVVVSTGVSAILQPWRRQAAYLGGAAAILELAVFGAGMLMQRQLRSQRLLSEARSAMAEAEAAKRAAEAELAVGRERERADRELQVQAVRFGAALGNMSEVLCLFDAADRLVVGNHRLATMLELPRDSIAPGMTIGEMGALLAQAPGLPPNDPQRLHGLILHLRGAGRRGSQFLDTQDGRRIAANFAPMEHDGWLVTLEDITEQRRVQARIEHMAHHDALTGLANRVLFQARLHDAMVRCGRGERYAVLNLDLDHFKAVNDTLGHPVGDALLVEVTRRMKLSVRETDTLARLGGDEFAIVQSITRPSDASALATRLIEALSAPYEINGERIIIGASAGIAIAPDDADDADAIMKNADLALYRSKADGRGRYRFFEAEMNVRMQARRTLDLDLRNALGQDEFQVFYQPLVNIASNEVCGFEALVRWRHPQRGMVSPAEFIPLAEETGLIIPLGRWVLRQACADAASWPDRLKVAVNLSPVQFNSKTIVADVAAALSDSGLPAGRLELEITETAILADADAVHLILHQLRDLGLRIALDDFGTGYSSLSYLQRFPFNKVKLDRSFVSKLGEGGGNDTIVAAVIDLCSRLGMATTGEGVETPAHLHCLAAMRCVEAQGYLFSRPRPNADVPEMVAKLRPRQLEAMDEQRVSACA